MPKTERNTPAAAHDASRRLGYARVSTYGQMLDVQLDQLRAEQCVKVYREKASGARADRRELLRLLKAVTPGDVVTVTRIDRLARSTFDLFAIVKQIVDAGGSFDLWRSPGLIPLPAPRAFQTIGAGAAGPAIRDQPMIAFVLAAVVMKDNVAGMGLAEQCIAPVVVAAGVEQRGAEVDADVLAIGRLKPVAFSEIIHPPSLGHNRLLVHELGPNYIGAE